MTSEISCDASLRLSVTLMPRPTLSGVMRCWLLGQLNRRRTPWVSSSRENLIGDFVGCGHIERLETPEQFSFKVFSLTHKTRFLQFTMQMDDFLRACLFVQVVYILSHYCHIVLFFQFSHQPMTFVRFYPPAFLAQHVVEIGYQRRIVEPTLMCCNLLYWIFFPKTVSITECLQPTLY